MIRIYLMLAALGLALSAIGGGVWYVRHLQHANASLRLQVASATARADLAEATSHIVERTITREVVVTRKAEESAHVVQSLPGASTPLDPAFAAGLRGELERVRASGGVGPDPHPASPVRTLPTPDP